MSSEQPDPFFLIIGIVIGWASAAALWNAAANTAAKKRIWNRYETEGINVDGFLIRETVTSHRTNFVETRKTYEAIYSYRVPESGRTYTRKYKKENPVGCAHGAQVQRLSRVFPVRLLPGHPKSGIPEMRVMDVENEIGGCQQIKGIVFSSFGVLFGALLFNIGFGDDFYPVIYLSSVLIFLFLGTSCIYCMFDTWERELLESTVSEMSTSPNQRRRREGTYEPVAATEVIEVPQGDDGRTSFPVAMATPINNDTLDVAEAGSPGIVLAGNKQNDS